MRKLTVVLAAMAAFAFAQEAPKEAAPTGPRAQKIFQVKHADVVSLHNAFHNLATVRADRNLRVLAVEGTPEAVAAIEDALKRLDVPQPPNRNVELTFHMILAKPGADGSLPADLAAVQKNLEGLFGFKGFQLFETAVMRGRDGAQLDSTGNAPNLAQAISEKTIYQLRAKPFVTVGAAGNLVRIDDLLLSLRVPYASGPGIQFRDARINTQIDVKEGQKVVVGKANVDGSDGALILVVTAKVVD
jgi:hypothetical protein